MKLDITPLEIIKHSYSDRIPKGTRDPILRAFKLISLFSSSNSGVTVRDIADDLNVDKETARYWLWRASLVLPIYESGFDYSGNRGRPGVKYSLLRD